MTDTLATTAPLAALPPSLFRVTSRRLHAPRPAVGFQTGVSSTLLVPTPMEHRCLATAADGSVWTLTSKSLCQYDVGRTELTAVAACKLYKPQPLGFPQQLAPVATGQAYFIQDSNGRPIISRYVANEDVTTLPALPENDLPITISAGADGTLWTLGNSGSAWIYQPTGNEKWQKAPADAGSKLVQITVASASLVLAVVQKGPLYRIAKWVAGKWVDHSSLMLPMSFWIGACEDGAYWLALPSLTGPVDLILFKDDQAVHTFSLKNGGVGFSATSRRACYFFGGGGFSRAAIGVLDQTTEEFPTLSDAEKRAYSHISTQLGVTAAKGLRSQYTNINAPFANWSSRLQSMARPATIAETDWNTIKDQLLDELEYVQSITTLSTNMAILNANLGLIQTNTYNEVVNLLGLPDKATDMPSSPVDFILNYLYEKIEGAVIDKAKEVIGAEVVSISLACYKYGNDLLAQKHDLPDGTVPMIIASSELAGVLADTVVQSEKARADFMTKILEDWGRLSACGEAIRSGLWYWGPGTVYDKIKGAGAANKLNFCQILIPVKWKIVLCQGVQSINPPLYPYMRYVPRYSLMYQYMGNGAGSALYWWAACMEVSAPETQTSIGPFPKQKILEAVFALDTTPQDFFAGTKGWKLPRVRVPGYTPPVGDVPWSPYENSTDPMK